MALIYDAAATAAITEIEMNALQHDILLALLHPRVSWTRRLITIRNFCLFFFLIQILNPLGFVWNVRNF